MPGPTSLDELKTYAAKNYATEPKPKNKRDGTVEMSWSINSRYLLIHICYNILGFKMPRTPRGKLPSTDAETMEMQTHPFAAQLTDYRSKSRTLASIQAADEQCLPASAWANPSSEGHRSRIIFNPATQDCVERVFTREPSIPINVDKRVRGCLLVSPEQIEVTDERVLAILSTEQA